MAVYAVGDVQGCYDQLRRLVDRLAFDPDQDCLWLTGDLVNRGAGSLDVLRYVRSLGSAAISVLGNHDLTLLAVRHGQVKLRKKDTFGDVLGAEDCDELLHWLRHRPMVHRDATLGWTMVHAGFVPQWDIELALACAGELERVLRSASFRAFLGHMYGDVPDQWSDDLEGFDRLRFITNCLTRLRFCDLQGRIAMKEKGEPGSQPAEFHPWFDVTWRRTAGESIVFGHWAMLGLHLGERVLGLDTGCAWGGRLSAARLDGELGITSVSCLPPR